MPSHDKPLGILTPIGGGDPVPLTKESMVVGRRATCDICLDFDNISSRHCELRYIKGVWHVRDLGSTNGTTVNGQRISSDQSVMPEVEFGLAGHMYTIDYEPIGPASLIENNGVVLDEEIADVRKKTSLMELAGLETDDKPAVRKRSTTPPARIERLSVDEADFDDALPESAKAKPAKKEEGPSEEDFLKIFE